MKIKHERLGVIAAALELRGAGTEARGAGVRRTILTLLEDAPLSARKSEALPRPYSLPPVDAALGTLALDCFCSCIVAYRARLNTSTTL